MSNEDRWLTSNEAAAHLGYGEYTLRQSRRTGKLAGKETPKFTKTGTAVRYKMSDLDAWVNSDSEAVSQ